MLMVVAILVTRFLIVRPLLTRLDIANAELQERNSADAFTLRPSAVPVSFDRSWAWRERRRRGARCSRYRPR